MDQLRILLSANLNVGTSLKDINQTIKAISNHKSLQRIKLKIDIDKSFTQSINQFIAATQKLKKISDENTRVLREETEQVKRLDGSIETVTKSYLKNGEIIEKSKKIHNEVKKSMQDEALAAKKLAESVEKQNKAELDSITVIKDKTNAVKGYKAVSSDGYTTTTQRLESDGQSLVGSTTATNYKKQRQDELRTQEQLNKQSEALDRAHFNAIKDNNKREEDMEKLHYLALQQNAKRNLDYQQAIARQQTKLDDVARRFGSDKNVKSAITQLNAELRNITPIGNYRNALSRLDTQLRSTAANASTARSSTLSLSESFKTAMIKFPINNHVGVKLL